MAYFLGRDIKVAMTLEADSQVISFASSNVTTGADADDNSVGNATGMLGRRAQQSSDSNAVDNIFVLQTTGHNTNPVSDLTGVDITLGTVDEDIAYMGQKTALKAEIKRETTLVLTMKKKDQFWSDLFTSFRYGVIDNAEASSYSGSEGDAIDGLSQPTAKFGYRAHLALNDDGSGEEEVIGFIDDVIIDGGGISYDEDDTIEIVPNEGAEIEPVIINGHIVDVNIVNGGQGFTSIPTITINSKTGIGAELTPVLGFKPIDQADPIDPGKIVTVIDCVSR